MSKGVRKIVWFKVDDKFHSHPKVMELTPSAVGLWALAGSWCADYLTDGAIRKGQIKRLGGSDNEAKELVDADLWIPTEDGWQFRDWTEYQPTREAVESEREAARERMKRAREHKRSSTDVRANNQRSSRNPVPDPVPEVPKGTSSSNTTSDKKEPDRPLPKDWAPTEAHQKIAKEMGVTLEWQAEQFKLHAETHDRRAARWNAAFTSWLKKANPSFEPHDLHRAKNGQPTFDPWAGDWSEDDYRKGNK